jgi:hypothetical protein
VSNQNREQRRALRRRRRRRREAGRAGPAPFSLARFLDRAIFLWMPIVIGVIAIIVVIIFLTR